MAHDTVPARKRGIPPAKKKKTSGFGLCKGAGPFVEDKESHADILGD